MLVAEISLKFGMIPLGDKETTSEAPSGDDGSPSACKGTPSVREAEKMRQHQVIKEEEVVLEQLVSQGEKEEKGELVGRLVGFELMVMMGVVEYFLFQFRKLEPYYLHQRVSQDWN